MCKLVSYFIIAPNCYYWFVLYLRHMFVCATLLASEH